MKSMKKPVTCYIIGIALAILLVLLQLAVLSSVTLNNRIQESTVDEILSFVLILAVFIGNWITCKLYGERSLIVTSIDTVIILSLLLFGSLIIEGRYQNILQGVLSVVVGGILSYVIYQMSIGKRRMRKGRYR